MTPTATPTPSIEEAAAQAAKSVVLIVLDKGACTGVQVKGGILTSAGCFASVREAQVVTGDNARAKAAVVRLDGKRDLALLQTDKDLALPPLEIGMARDQRIGQPVAALAYPSSGQSSGGDSAPDKVAVVQGQLSGIRDDEPSGAKLVDTNAILDSGTAGGPVVNARGELIGVVSLSLRNAMSWSTGVAGETIASFISGPALPVPTVAPKTTPTRTPTATPLPLRRLATGTFVKDMTRKGLGQFRAYNLGTLDAVIGIRSLDRKRSSLIYVRAGGNFIIKGIPDGTYDVIYVQGEDYDRASGTFTRKTDGWMRFENTLLFKTTTTKTGRTYKTWWVKIGMPSGGDWVAWPDM